MSNKGAPGIDGMSVEALAAHLRAEWPAIRERLLAGTYRPAAVRRHELPKPGGGVRVLGIPTVLDRMIQQATLQVLQPEWDPTFSEESYCNIYVGSRRAGQRVMNSIGRFLTDRLKLKVNEAKSAVAKPYERSFLGFSIVRGGKTSVSAKARERLKARIREMTSRNRG